MIVYSPQEISYLHQDLTVFHIVVSLNTIPSTNIVLSVPLIAVTASLVITINVSVAM